ncbi:hypothetical protein THRCLA_22343 [Thraustotheca clavata]|uniref:non-specific serine/threonine protein kinase n=1 Tax=Thraustotheca clavata TaxID=74557 RepID=A0A1V9Z589_9STRA|nr:hypothetical protein THRCLA_22343 [Thraustotheca clavata]
MKGCGVTSIKANKIPTANQRERIIKALEANDSLELYQLGPIVGKGQFGQVRTSIHRLSQQKVALKVFSKVKAVVVNQIQCIKKEIDIMKEIDHPSIVRLYEIIETKDHITIVMEYCEGEDLASYIHRRVKLDENLVCALFRQITDAIAYLHRKSIIHRDIKPQNIIVQEHNSNVIVKLVDFGLGARDPTTLCKLTAFCGTPAFMAPEIIAQKQYDGKPVDAWSLGVLLFYMVTGKVPFEAPTSAELYPKISRGVFEIPAYISTRLSDLLRSILVIDAERRLSVDQIRHHPWLYIEEQQRNTRIPVLLASLTSLFVADAAIHRAILSEMAIYGLKKEDILDDLASKTYNGVTAWYRLLHLQNLKNKSRPSSTPATLMRSESKSTSLTSEEFSRFLQEKFNKAKNKIDLNQ